MKKTFLLTIISCLFICCEKPNSINENEQTTENKSKYNKYEVYLSFDEPKEGLDSLEKYVSIHCDLTFFDTNGKKDFVNINSKSKWKVYDIGVISNQGKVFYETKMEVIRSTSMSISIYKQQFYREEDLKLKLKIIKNGKVIKDELFVLKKKEHFFEKFEFL